MIWNSLVIGKHKGVKFHCYADDAQVYIHLSQKNSSLCPAEFVKNLGVWFDLDISLSKHVQNVFKSCFVDMSGGFLLIMLLYL